MMNAFPFCEIENKIAYVFKEKALLKEAFTHSTYAHRFGGKDNERLEYLGDAVLQLVVTEWQYLGDEHATEGKLTATRQTIVCKDALDTAVDALDIWQYLQTAGRQTDNVGDKAKSSLFEAVTAAIYLDGGYAAAKAFVLRHGNLRLDTQAENPISKLKEYLEKRGEKEPLETWEKTGKDNAPNFKCELTAMGQSARGAGKNKREAKAIAASRLLWELKNAPADKATKNAADKAIQNGDKA